MHEGNAYIWRCIKQHRLLPRAIRSAFAQVEIDNAERSLEQLGVDAEPGVKAAVKVGEVLNYYDADPEGANCFAVLVLQRPLCHYLDRVLF